MFTYHSGVHSSTVDYVILNLSAAHISDHVETLNDHPLNTSDHLPLSVSVLATPTLAEESGRGPSVNWDRAVQSNLIPEYIARVGPLLSPLLGRSYSSVEELEQEVSSVCSLLVSAAVDTLPTFKTTAPKKRKFTDGELKRMCNSNRSTWSSWNMAGRPNSGPLWEEKKRLKKTIRERIHLLRGVEVRKKISRIDQQFKSGDKNRFKLRKSASTPAAKLRVDGRVISDCSDVLEEWSRHFKSLSASRIDQSHPIHSQIQTLWVRFLL